MTELRQPDALTRPHLAEGPGQPSVRRTLGAGAALLLLGAVLVVVAGWHLTQGTSGIGVGEVWRAMTGRHTTAMAHDVLVGSRLPRLAAGIAVGFALGVAGALFQSIARNALASPDTLAVTSGAFLALTAVAAFGLSVPLWASGAVAVTGGLLAAALVLSLSGAAGTSTTRLILAGSAVAMALEAGAATLLILYAQATKGLYAWGNGSLSQLGLDAFRQAAPVIGGVTLCALLLARRLDLLGLGDDTAGALGVPVRSTRIAGVLLAVLLTAASVTLAGPLGFVGLYAPAIARLLGRVVPAFHRHLVLIPAAGLVGAISVVLADALLRWLIGAETAASIPTGVTTTIFGSIFLILLARGSRDAGPTREPPAATVGVRSRGRFVAVLGVGIAAVAGLALTSLLVGQLRLLPGDVVTWLDGSAHPLVRFALDERAPRVAAALLAGAALALSGSLVQACCRNPLAEPGLLGITGGAGLGAVLVVTHGSNAIGPITAASIAGALVAFALVYGLAWRGGLGADRLVLIGVGVWSLTSALTAYLLLRANPWDTPRIFTWLSGTTYGRTWEQVVPVAVVLVVALPLAVLVRRELDLLALDEDSPRIVGVSLERTRLLVLAVAALLAATAVGAVGVVGFVGLVAPHAARAVVGGRHSRSVPVAVLIGAGLLTLADALGRTVIAPAQIPAGLVVAAIGAPYFVYLLSRSRQ